MIRIGFTQPEQFSACNSGQSSPVVWTLTYNISHRLSFACSENIGIGRYLSQVHNCWTELASSEDLDINILIPLSVHAFVESMVKLLSELHTSGQN